MSIEDVEHLAFEAMEAENYEEAQRLLIPLSEQGSAYASNTLGWIHEVGVLGEANKDVARSYYEKAAEAGYSEGFYGLGSVLLSECKEAEEARQAFEKGAEMGNLSCMYKFGTLLTEKADQLERNAGLAWLHKAAGHGHVWSQRRLLSIRYRASKSAIEKAVIRFTVLRKTIAACALYLRDKHSEKLN